MTLSFIPLGIGDAFSALHYGACLAVEAEGKWLLIDCPHPIRKMLREGGVRAGVPDLDVGSFEGLVLTHLHADHASGLEGWGFFHHFALQRRAIVLTHPTVARDLWSTLAPSMGVLLRGPERKEKAYAEEDYFDVRPFVDEITLGPFTVRCRTTWHHIPTIALRIEGQRAHARVQRRHRVRTPPCSSGSPTPTSSFTKRISVEPTRPTRSSPPSTPRCARRCVSSRSRTTSTSTLR